MPLVNLSVEEAAHIQRRRELHPVYRTLLDRQMKLLSDTKIVKHVIRPILRVVPAR
jgi:hypothetical protein